VTCKCGLLKREIPCLCKNDPETIAMVEKGTYRWAPPQLECEEICRIAARRKQLAIAFEKATPSADLSTFVQEELQKMNRQEINSGKSGLDLTQKSIEYGDFLVQFAISKRDTILEIEERLAKFLDGEMKDITLEAMDRIHRRLYHTLAKFYNITSYSEGSGESSRCVILSKGPTSQRPPILLSDVASVSRPTSSTMLVPLSVPDVPASCILRISSSTKMEYRQIQDIVFDAGMCQLIIFDNHHAMIECPDISALQYIRLSLIPYGINID